MKHIIIMILLTPLLAVPRNDSGFPIPPIYRPHNPCATMEAKPFRGQVMTMDNSCPNGWRWRKR